MAESLCVELGDRSYQIVFAPLENATDELRAAIGDGRCLCVTDSRVQELHGERVGGLVAGLNPDFAEYVLPSGEESKRPEIAIDLCRFAAQMKFDRATRMVAVGGGVTGDLTGFAAAIFLRGVRFIQIPTTLLAMVDSSVGGKTGVDLPEGKNLVGCFHQPRLVVIDVRFLKTLPEREIAGGLAEVVKYAVIFDATLFSLLENNLAALKRLELDFYSRIIRRSCEHKARVVQADEREAGCRALLNYGHTFGHAVEQLSHFAISHGEGVAIGMNIAAELAVRTGRLALADADRQRKLLLELDLPVALPREFSAEAMFEAMSRDKKCARGRINFVLPDGLGNAGVVGDCDEELIKTVMESCRA